VQQISETERYEARLLRAIRPWLSRAQIVQ
jgi:hypothetical protein